MPDPNTVSMLDEFIAREAAARRAAAARERVLSLADELRKVDAEIAGHIAAARPHVAALRGRLGSVERPEVTE